MAIRIKLSEKYKAANQKRIGTFVVNRKWNFVDEKIARIAEKFDPKGNIYEISKAISKPNELKKIIKSKPPKMEIPKDADNEDIIEDIWNEKNNQKFESNKKKKKKKKK